MCSRSDVLAARQHLSSFASPAPVDYQERSGHVPSSPAPFPSQASTLPISLPPFLPAHPRPPIPHNTSKQAPISLQYPSPFNLHRRRQIDIWPSKCPYPSLSALKRVNQTFVLCRKVISGRCGHVINRQIVVHLWITFNLLAAETG